MTTETTPVTVTSRLWAKADAELRMEVHAATWDLYEIVAGNNGRMPLLEIKVPCGIGSEAVVAPKALFNRLAEIAFERRAPARRGAAVREFMAKVAELEKMTHREGE